MVIKIQTFESITSISVKRSATVQDLKDKILENFNVPVPKQRLIFQGKLLQNVEKLKSYKVGDESVIHLVAKSMDDGVQSSSPNTNPINNPEVNVEDLFPSLLDLPLLRSSRRQRRRRLPHFDISECFESMHQNINTMQNLFNCKAKWDESTAFQSRTISGFDLSKSKYEVGQWVDVKDTIDQWLEAQVIAVRSTQAFIHYNGWGTRWDEWIDFSSPRIAPFKTFTMQSPASVFLSPYPQVACDANVEAQPRSIDTFYYMEKTFGFVSELNKMVDYMARLRKKNFNFQGRSLVRRDDFEVEAREKESQALQRGSQISLNNNDYELLHCFTQLVPLMDRCGRLFSDSSLQISHLLLNPSLYPQLLLGYNNQELSDTMSCTSGYSMYTNEGSTVSGLNQMQFMSENLQRSIVTSNQMVNSYSNQVNNQSQSEARPSSFNSESFPKINMQVPSMLSPGEVVMYNGYNGYTGYNYSGLNSYLEPNIDIYVHTLVSNNAGGNSGNSTGNSTNNIVNANVNNLSSANQTSPNMININTTQQVANSNPSSLLNYNNQIFNDTDIVENPRREQTSTSNSVSNLNLNAGTTTANNREVNNNNNNLNGMLENLMTMINHRRRGSITSDTSNTSSRLGREPLSNLHPNSNSNRSRPARPTTTLSVGSLYRETGTQTDIPLNLLLNKESNYSDNLMEIISNKSNRSVTGLSLKNRGAISYKSVSEISEFEEIDQEEPSEFVVVNNNKKESVNESMHSVNSHVSKEVFEEKDEENSAKNKSKDSNEIIRNKDFK